MSDDRILGPIAALVRRLTSHVDYYAQYPAQVIVQAADGTLDVQPEDPRVPPMQGVPIRYGLPGVTVKVAPGGRVLLGFEGGNPQRPIVTLWDFASVTEITVTATGTVNINGGAIVLNGGTLNVARAGDSCTHALFVGEIPVTGTINIGLSAGNPTVKA